MSQVGGSGSVGTVHVHLCKLLLHLSEPIGTGRRPMAWWDGDGHDEVVVAARTRGVGR
jgi:hypothetical protein